MKYSWVLLSLFLAIITAISAVSYKYIGSKTHNETNMMLIGLVCIILAAIISIPILCYHRKKLLPIYNDIKNNNKPIQILIPVIAIIIILNICLTMCAFNKVENPAYANIIKNTNVIFILIISIILFKSKIDIKSILGVILCIIGITFIIMNN